MSEETRDDELAGDLDLDEGDTGDVVGGASAPSSPTGTVSMHGTTGTGSGGGTAKGGATLPDGS